MRTGKTGDAAPRHEPVDAVTRILGRALRALGEAGQAATASELAAAAWTALRHEHPTEAERLTGILHYLARLPADTDPTRAQAPLPRDAAKETTVTDHDKQLDVRSEPPARRHDLIFETFHALGAGEGFVLVNDHDPKPLYYQFAAEHAGAFSWDYLEEGPETWRVRIGRTTDTADSKA